MFGRVRLGMLGLVSDGPRFGSDTLLNGFLVLRASIHVFRHRQFGGV